MQLKKYFDYRMNFRRNWTIASGALMGMALFARMVYYFGLMDISSMDVFELVFQMALPLLLCAAYVILLRFVKLNAPGVFGILGVALYVLIMMGTIYTGDIVRAILAVLAYVSVSALLLLTVGGHLPDKVFVLAVSFWIPALRLLVYDLGGFLAADGLFAKISYLGSHMVCFSDMLVLIALFCLPMCLKPAQK